MKTCIKLFFLSFALLAFTGAMAQTKIGHLNSVDLLGSLNEWKTAQVDLETFAKKNSGTVKNKRKNRC